MQISCCSAVGPTSRPHDMRPDTDLQWAIALEEPMSAETAEQSQARFVFRGTVQKLNAATLPTIADTNQTIVVRIDQIIRGPDVCKDFVGRQVTVQVEENVKFK